MYGNITVHSVNPNVMNKLITGKDKIVFRTVFDD